MNTCPKCNANIRDYQLFCLSCRHQLKEINKLTALEATMGVLSDESYDNSPTGLVVLMKYHETTLGELIDYGKTLTVLTGHYDKQPKRFGYKKWAENQRLLLGALAIKSGFMHPRSTSTSTPPGCGNIAFELTKIYTESETFTENHNKYLSTKDVVSFNNAKLALDEISTRYNNAVSLFDQLRLTIKKMANTQ